jgi:hypothetical protein
MFPNERPKPPAEGFFPAQNEENGETTPFPASCAHVENQNLSLCTTGSTSQAFHKPLWIGPPLFPPKNGAQKSTTTDFVPYDIEKPSKGRFFAINADFPARSPQKIPDPATGIAPAVE